MVRVSLLFSSQSSRCRGRAPYKSDRAVSGNSEPGRIACSSSSASLYDSTIAELVWGRGCTGSRSDVDPSGSVGMFDQSGWLVTSTRDVRWTQGAVPILLGSYILETTIVDAHRLYGIVVVVVVFSVLGKGSLVPLVARRLRIEMSETLTDLVDVADVSLVAGELFDVALGVGLVHPAVVRRSRAMSGRRL